MTTKPKLTLEELADRDPEIRRMLDEPVGTPIKLTREQAIAVVEAGIGTRPDLPTGVEFVRQARKLWRFLEPRDRRPS